MKKQKHISPERPESLDCETGILCSILLFNESFNQAAGHLIAADFSLDSHRIIYSKIAELMARRGAADYQLLVEELRAHGELEAIGGREYIESLMRDNPRIKNIGHYVDVVREKSRARMLLAMADSITGQIHEFTPTDEVLADIQQKLIELVYHGRAGKSISIKDACIETLSELNDIRKSVGMCIGLSTGIRPLDELTTGIRKSEFYIVGARPGNGKTAWMCQSVLENARRGKMVSVFSMEVPRQQIICRLACQLADMSVFDTRDPRVLNEVEMMRLADAIAVISTLPIIIEDSPRMTMKQLAGIARLHISQGSECIYVDFLQKMRHPGKTEYDRVTGIADGLWELGRSTGVPVVALSQLKRSREVPTMDDLRSSGEIEQNANAIFLLWRPFEIDSTTQMISFTKLDQIIIAKQRSGVAGTHVPVEFNGRVGRFDERILVS